MTLIVLGAIAMIWAIFNDPWGRSKVAACVFLVGASAFLLGAVAFR